jgi:RNA-directed DNA polymerase
LPTIFVAGFEHRHEAEPCLAELRERLAQFGLALHADKTRIVEFGRFTVQNRRKRGDGKPETFNSLVLRIVAENAKGTSHRTAAEVSRELRALKGELRRRMHTPIE